MGIVVCGSGMGGVIYPIAMKRLFDELSEPIPPILSNVLTGRLSRRDAHYRGHECSLDAPFLVLPQSTTTTSYPTAVQEPTRTLASSPLRFPRHGLLSYYDEVGFWFC